MDKVNAPYRRLARAPATSYIWGGGPTPKTKSSHGMPQVDWRGHMAELNDIYNTKLIELAGASTRGSRLSAPDASATAHSKLCGSTVAIDLKVAGGKVSDYGQTVKACLLGQAAAAVVAREIVGTSPDEFRQVAAQMRAMLKDNGPPPTGRWADLAALEPVRDYKARHASTLLVFDAVEKALDEVSAKQAALP